MSASLRLQDFIWISIDGTKLNGYYSFKFKSWEICLDQSFVTDWGVYLANKFGEVVEEHFFISQEDALNKANEMYKKLKVMLCK